MRGYVTPAKALAEFVRAQITLAGCCRALEPLIALARDGDAEAARHVMELAAWLCAGGLDAPPGAAGRAHLRR